MAKQKSTRETPPPGNARWPMVQPWISLVARLGLAAVALWAGLSKIGNLDGSVSSVRAYDLFPESINSLIGNALPILEIAAGLFLLAGLLTRWVAVAWGLLMVVFIIGIASAWARGLNIDCGCFSIGGDIAPDQTRYLEEILRDVAFLAASVFLVIWPRSKFSADKALGLEA